MTMANAQTAPGALALSLGSRMCSVTCQNGVSKVPTHNVITHIHRQKMASGKKYHFYLSLRKAEQPCFPFFFFSAEITVLPSFSQLLQ